MCKTSNTRTARVKENDIPQVILLHVNCPENLENWVSNGSGDARLLPACEGAVDAERSIPESFASPVKELISFLAVPL